MRFKILSIAAIAAFTFPAFAQETEEPVIELTETHQGVIDAAGNMLVALAESKLADMANLQPQDFITDDMIRAAVRGYGWGTLRGKSRGAREHVFTHYQCSIFTHFENPSNKCRGMLGSESSEPNDRYAGQSSLPAELPMLSRQMRQQIYAVGRGYLKSPENLRTTYDTHVDVMVDEFNQLFFVDQQEFRAMLKTILTVIKESRDPTIAELLAAEQKAVRDLRFHRQVDVTSEKFDEAKVAHDTAVAAREEAVTDLPSLEFINRRSIEGGPDLVVMYEEIFTDLLARVSAN